MKFEPSKELCEHQVLFAFWAGLILYMIFFFFSTTEPRSTVEQLSAAAMCIVEIYFAISEAFCMIHAYMEQIKDEKNSSK